MSVCKKCSRPLKRVKGANHDGSDRWICPSRTCPVATDSIYTKFYDGDIPPWDESFGEFEPC
jgi:hypothetical protein